MKSRSVRLLDIITDALGLQVLCGDIDNASIQTHTTEKIYTRVGPEFGDRAYSLAIISRAIYGLTTRAKRFRTLLANFLRSLGFTPSRFDRDVWMRLQDSKNGYDYICTHLDDFKIVAEDTDGWLRMISNAFLVKSYDPRSYYLGNDYTYHEELDVWTYGGSTYTNDTIGRVERIYGCIPNMSTPLPVTD